MGSTFNTPSVRFSLYSCKQCKLFSVSLSMLYTSYKHPNGLLELITERLGPQKYSAFLTVYVHCLILWFIGAEDEALLIHIRTSGFLPSNPLSSLWIIYYLFLSDNLLTTSTCMCSGDQRATFPALRLWGEWEYGLNAKVLISNSGNLSFPSRNRLWQIT